MKNKIYGYYTRFNSKKVAFVESWFFKYMVEAMVRF